MNNKLLTVINSRGALHNNGAAVVAAFAYGRRACPPAGSHRAGRTADPLFAAEAKLHLGPEHPCDLFICRAVRLDMDAGGPALCDQLSAVDVLQIAAPKGTEEARRSRNPRCAPLRLHQRRLSGATNLSAEDLDCLDAGIDYRRCQHLAARR